jgi:hypothetical protein
MVIPCHFARKARLFYEKNSNFPLQMLTNRSCLWFFDFYRSIRTLSKTLHTLTSRPAHELPLRATTDDGTKPEGAPAMSTRIFSSILRKTMPSGATITRQAQKAFKQADYSGAQSALSNDLFQSIKAQGAKVKYGWDSTGQTPYMRITDKAGAKQGRIYLTQGAKGTEAETQTRLSIQQSLDGITASRLYRDLRAKPGKAGKPAKPLSQKEAQRELERETAHHQRQQEKLNGINGTTDQAEALAKAKRDSDTLAQVDRTTRQQRVLQYNQGMTEEEALRRAEAESKLLATAPRPPVVRERVSLPEIQPERERPTSSSNRLQRSRSLTQDSSSATAFRLEDWQSPPPRPSKRPSLSKETYVADLEASSLRDHTPSQPSLAAKAQEQSWSFSNLSANHSATSSIADNNPYQDLRPSPLTSPFGTIKRPRSGQLDNTDFSSGSFPSRYVSLRDRNPQFSTSEPDLVSPMNSVRRPRQQSDLASPFFSRSYRPFDGSDPMMRSTSPTISSYASTPRRQSLVLGDETLTPQTSHSDSYFPASTSRVELAKQTERQSNNASPHSEMDDEEHDLMLESMRARLAALQS